MTKSPEVVIFRMAELEIDPVHLEEYKALLTEEIEASVSLEPGVIFLNAVYETSDPTRVRVFECYANQAAYEHHIQAPHFLKYKTGTLAMVKSLKLIDVEPIAMAGK
jgi:quinol monooxygenase YgiN